MGLFFNKGTMLHSPAEGEILNITQSVDEVFSSKMMGDGFIVNPSNGKFFSPVKGKVELIFDTKHAISIKTPTGYDILIHMGIDTVKLKGEGYNVLVSQGQDVEVGTPIADVDIEAIKSKGFSVETAIIITNLEDKEVELIKTGNSKPKEEILKMTRE